MDEKKEPTPRERMRDWNRTLLDTVIRKFDNPDDSMRWPVLPRCGGCGFQFTSPTQAHACPGHNANLRPRR
jgi:hypothetical protein